MHDRLTVGGEECRSIEWERLHDDAYRWEVVAALWQDHGNAVRQYCASWLRGEQAREVAQDIFVTVWYRLPAYRPDKPIRTWLLGIARHTCQRARRNQTRRQMMVQTCVVEIRDQAHAEEPTILEHLVVQARQRKRLYDSLAKLTAEEQTLLAWWYWQELSLREIAALLGKSISVVRKRLARAEQRLKASIDEIAAV